MAPEQSDAIPGLRRLPWEDEGKPVYLSSYGGPDSVLSIMADAVEDEQLLDAGRVLEHAYAMLAAPDAPPEELRGALRRVVESGRAVLRIAEVRGERLE